MRVSALDVSVIIVTARDAPRLARCLDAVRRADPGLALEVVVVLNAAERGMEDAANSATRVVRSDVPLGFAAGANLGASVACGRHLHLLHDDAIVEPGAISALVRALDEDPRAGAAGSLLLDPDGTTLQGAGHVLWRDGRTEPPWRGTPPDPGAFTETRVVDYCSSASLLVRADAWHAAGGFDEELHPAQFVDVDLAMRLRACGYLVVCAPASRARHARGGTAGSAVRRVAWERNRARFLETWAEDLGWQEPFADDDGALTRALEATRTRARAVEAIAPAPAPAAAPAEDRATRERRAVQRDLEFKAACVRELERVDTRAAELERELAAARQELHRVHTAHGVEMAHRKAFAAERDALAARVDAQDDAIAYLRQREQVLDAIVAGRWWRLRERLVGVRRRLATSPRAGRDARSSRS
jgi:GT2 family glycosyltransferase